jgi:hypothetical protein
LAGAFDAIEAHEKLCAERYGAIRDDISDLKGIVKSLGKMLAGLPWPVGLGASQIYADLKAARALQVFPGGGPLSFRLKFFVAEP